MLALDLACGLDASRLLARVGLQSDPWQTDLLSRCPKEALLLCSRQAGKSTVTALMALHEALYRPPALVLLLSPSQRQSAELFRKVMDFYYAIGQPVKTEQESALRLELVNGSRIVSLPGKEETIRGFSGVRLLVVDEASRVPDELYFSVRPMLAVSGGRLVCLSTPFGKRGFFFHEWHEGLNWKRYKVTAHDCPRIASGFLERERAAIGDWWFNQEYLCEFTETDDQAFSHDLIQAALSDEVKPLF